MNTVLRSILRVTVYRLMPRGKFSVVLIGVIALVALVMANGAKAAELNYVERTSNLTVTSTTEATPNDWISGTAVTYDGSTKVKIEVYAQNASVCSSGGNLLLSLWDGATNLGRIGDFGQVATTGCQGVSATMHRYVTPSAGSHTYHVKAFKGSGSTALLLSGTGGSGNALPSYIRISSEATGGAGADELSDLTDVNLTGLSDNDILKWDASNSEWIVTVDEQGSGGGAAAVCGDGVLPACEIDGTVMIANPVELSEEDRDRSDLAWYGSWAIVGLLLALMIAPKFSSLLDPTRGA